MMVTRNIVFLQYIVFLLKKEMLSCQKGVESKTFVLSRLKLDYISIKAAFSSAIAAVASSTAAAPDMSNFIPLMLRAGLSE